jgi:hypothetical protein
MKTKIFLGNELLFSFKCFTEICFALVHIMSVIHAKDTREQVAEEIVWVGEAGSNRRLGE